MPLTSGTRLGPYEILEPIGAGGMGEVYRARDTKLDRDVAIKVLPEEFASDPERLARFEREAKLLASLNHPNIASIHGFEESDGINALVMELVEGPTLAERIEQGRLPVDEAIAIAKQIAEALEAGHEAGVIHRDLKPANIKLKEDGTVKVLDYGLAKALEGDSLSGADSELSQSPTLMRHGTQVGVILGTAAYMSPEQAKGKTVDKRTDVWAFGAVVYEMLTGKRVFVGEDISDTLAAVLRAEPAWEALPSDLSPTLHTYLTRCLEKDRKHRVRDIGDVGLALAGAFETKAATPVEADTAPSLRLWHRPVPLLLAGLSLLVIGAVGAWEFGRSPAPGAGTVTRLSFIAPEGDSIDTVHGMALSPDGTTLVYGADRDRVPQLFVRLRDQMEVRRLSGTEGASHPFFSPDGAWVGFFTDNALKKISLAGGPPVTLCAVGARFGASWGPDDTIVFASGDSDALMTVSARGGEPRPLTEPATGTEHRWPNFVPGVRAVTYTITSPGGFDTFEVALGLLETGAQETLVRGTDGTVTASGHLVFGRKASLWAMPFDTSRLAVSGEPTPMVEGVQVNSGGWARYALADDGTLVYLPGGEGGDDQRLVWIDRVSGEQEPVAVPSGSYFHPRVSPDGTRVAVDSGSQYLDIWVAGLTRESLTRLTVDPASDRYGIWTRDSQRVIFSSERGGGVAALYSRAADGTGTADRLGESESPRYPKAVVPDGSVVVAEEVVDGNRNLITVSLTGDPVREDLLVTEFDERNAAVSPDGEWFAYQSNASGVDEIYVRPFSDADSARHQISTNGGKNPLWAPNGNELFFESAGRLVAVKVQMSPTFSRGVPEVAIEEYLAPDIFQGRRYDIDPNGERFLLVQQLARERGAASLTFVLNWFEELERLVPTQ